MKNLLKYILSTITFLLFASTANAQDQQTSYKVEVEGLGCPYCAIAVEKQINTFEGMTNFILKLDEGVVEFQSNAKEAPTEAEIKARIKESGYTTKSVVIKKDSITP